MPQTGAVRTSEIQNHSEHAAESAATKNPKAIHEEESAPHEAQPPVDKLHHGKAASPKK